MRRQRLASALGIAVLCAPGTFVRTHIPDEMPRNIAVQRVAGPAATQEAPWSVAGVWHYSAQHRHFGGYSGLLALPGDRLLALSDRGSRFAFAEPGSDTELPGVPSVALQEVAQHPDDLQDIESATRDASSGQYWLGFEQLHAIYRYTPEHEPDGLRLLGDAVDWPENGGAEAMIRLADGRFMVLPEGDEEGLLFASDPVAGGPPRTFAFRRPAQGFAATDLAQLPDGRVVLLMRDTVLALPPFETLLAIGPPPRAGGTFAPEIALRLDGIIPSENYEALAVRELPDGRVALWIMSDDNQSIMQRTLLAKLVYEPSAGPGV